MHGENRIVTHIMTFQHGTLHGILTAVVLGEFHRFFARLIKLGSLSGSDLMVGPDSTICPLYGLINGWVKREE